MVTGRLQSETYPESQRRAGLNGAKRLQYEFVPADIGSFVRESNRIEGILRDPLPHEIRAHESFLSQRPSLSGLCKFVSEVQPGAVLRTARGLDVKVGRYTPPPGGPHIEGQLLRILDDLENPFLAHQKYETLHPFTDGNGRSGRALWLWMMGGLAGAPLGFLHHWYYQSLQHFCGLTPDVGISRQIG